MSNLIKGITSKLSKLEIENRVVARPPQEGKINVHQYKRPFQSQQIMQRETRPIDDQRVQPPLNNFVAENQQEDEEIEHEINFIGGLDQPSFLTLAEYEELFSINQLSNENGDIFNQDN